MKLVHPDYTFQIEFEECRIERLIIESPTFFSAMIRDLQLQTEGKPGKWVLSDQAEILKIASNCELVVNLFDVDSNQRKLLNVIYGNLEKQIGETELLLKWNEITTGVEQLLNLAIEETDLDLVFETPDLKSVLKMSDIHFERNETGYVEYLMEYLRLVSQIRGVSLFVLVNTSSFLTQEELKFLYEQAFYKKYHLLLLDSFYVPVDSSVENTIIIDKDYCIIDINMK